MLAGHLDVVPVVQEKWDYDAFAATEENGYIYARGAIDVKQVVMVSYTRCNNFMK